MLDDSMAMGDEEESLVRTHPLGEVLEKARFGVGIQCRRSFVEKQNVAVVQECTGYADALGLTLRETGSVLSASAVETLRQGEDKLCTGSVQGVAHLFLSGIGVAQEQVVAYGAGE